GGKVEPAFYENPSLVDWLYRNRPGGPPDPVPTPADALRIAPEDEAVRVHRGLGPDDILLAVGGGEAGGHSAFFPSWSPGRSGPFITREVPACLASSIRPSARRRRSPHCPTRHGRPGSRAARSGCSPTASPTGWRCSSASPPGSRSATAWPRSCASPRPTPA